MIGMLNDGCAYEMNWESNAYMKWEHGKLYAGREKQKKKKKKDITGYA